MPDLPTGTVTFLASDLADMTPEAVPPAERRALLERQGNLVGDAIEAYGGVQFRAEGATLFGAFSSAGPALSTLLDIRDSVAALTADDALRQRLRLVLYTTETDVVAGRYLPASLRHIARLLHAARSGQTLIGATTANLLRDQLPAHLAIQDLGDHHFSDLHPVERIHQLVTIAGPLDQRPIRSLDWHPHNLPAQLSPLIGRDAEQAAVESLLRRPHIRLVTLTGPGGIGKTRLAMHIAAGLVDAFDDGVFFVPLAPIADATQVLPAIARTLDVVTPEARDVVQTLLTYLAERQMLLVLDNLEHVVEAAPDIAGLMANCPSVKVLATSRETLNVQGEHSFPVPSLAVPDQGSPASATGVSAADAVRLFVTRAKEVAPRFKLSDETAPVVAEICRRLDGLPLAIELAAASANILSPPQLLERLEQHLPLPSAERRDIPARHQTLRDTIGWSHDLLTDDEQILFRRLAVFAGSFDLDAAEAVGRRESGVGRVDVGITPDSRLPSPDSVLDGISALVSKSLLQPRTLVEPSAIGPRFAMLRTIHEFALERLDTSGEARDIRRRHLDWFVALAERADGELAGPAQAEWLARLDADLDDLRFALRWSIDQQDAETALRLGCALWRYWARRGFLREGQDWLDQALRLETTAAPALRARALNHLGNIANDLDDYARARQLYEKSLHLRRATDDRSGIADTTLNLGVIAVYQGDYVRAQQLADESYAFYRAQGDDTGATFAISLSGDIATATGDAARARTHYQQVIQFQTDRGDAIGVAYAQWRQARAAASAGDRPLARQLSDACLATFRALSDRLGTAHSLGVVAMLALNEGDGPRASSRLDEALRIWQETDRRLGVVECVEGFGSVAAEAGAPDVAARLFGAAAAWRIALGAPLTVPAREHVGASIEKIRADFGSDHFHAAWNRGEAMTLEQAAEEARQVITLFGPTRQPRTGHGGDAASGLTARELDVLRQIASRRSNAEIADDLDISLRTVTTHVANIFTKLGIHSRTAAAAYAMQSGVV